MPKNEYDLYNKEDRKDLYYNFLLEVKPDIIFCEFEANIEFLCKKNISSEWLTVHRIILGNQICPNKLKIGERLYTSVDILELFDLSKCLKVFDDDKINYYIHRLNTQSIDRISAVSEIKIASKYVMAGHEIVNEPLNKRIGKSGHEGKSDLAVKLKDEWIHFEINQENFPQMKDSDYKIAEINSKIEEEIKEKNLLQPSMRIIATIVNRNKVLSIGWTDKFIEFLKTSFLEKDTLAHFDGVEYKVVNRMPDEPVFLLSYPIIVEKKIYQKDKTRIEADP